MGVDQIFRGWAQRGVQRDEIALGEQLLEWNQLNLDFARGGFADVRVIAENLHVESFGAHRDFAADAAEADEAQSLAANFRSGGAGFFPAAFVDGFVVAGHLASEREEQRESVLRDADGVSAGRAHDQDAAAGGFLQVDVVYADSGAADHAEAGGFFQELRRYLRRAANHQSIGVGDFRMQRIFRGQDNVPSRAAQQLHSAVTDFVCNDYFHRASRDLLWIPQR